MRSLGSGPRFSEIGKPNLGSGSEFAKFMKKPDQTGLWTHYSLWFHPTASDQTDCPRCGELHTAHHILQDDNCYIIKHVGLLDSLLKHALTTFSGGLKLAKFIHINQVFLCPLNPIPLDIPSEPDP
jgi:hypothetical protein